MFNFPARVRTCSICFPLCCYVSCLGLPLTSYTAIGLGVPLLPLLYFLCLLARGMLQPFRSLFSCRGFIHFESGASLQRAFRSLFFPLLDFLAPSKNRRLELCLPRLTLCSILVLC